MKQELKWIKAIKKRSSESAANQLIGKYYKEMYAFIYKQIIDQELAKDITQEIFISALKTIHLFNGKASFRTWLYKIANSRLIDYYRSKSYKQSQKTDVMDGVDIRTEDSFTIKLEQKEEVGHVLQVLAQFNQQNQYILRLKIFGEYTFLEIAEITNLTESTVKTKYYATIRKLKQLLMEGASNEKTK
ncbi:RNA polymerase sigma factor [Gracilibacillus xinjiangensis]|uniref:RNA polymerase sigma factor n=1 Tax=Gracilibacillus xinjiangensis TaxID=1193282 RepID=A0ABV8WRB7_9BACI